MQKISNITRAFSVAVIAAAIACSAGCAKPFSWKPSKMFSLDNSWPFADEDEPHEGTPARMVGTWTDTVLTQQGKPPERGFGGRIMFYDRHEKEPILVDGELVVYAFDETDRDPTDNKPNRRYVFPADQMAIHMSKSEFGASYSFWLPWDEAGGPKTEVSLICRFQPKDGPVVTSEQTHHMLPGAIAAPGTAGRKQPPKLPEGVPSKPVQQTLQSLQTKRTEERNTQLASYEAPVAGQPQVVQAAGVAVDAETPSRRMTSTTIPLPGSFQMPNNAGYSPPPAASLQPPAAQPILQYNPGQTQLQQPATTVTRSSIATMPAGAVQPPAKTQPFTGGQAVPVQSTAMGTSVTYGSSPAGFAAQSPQLPLGSQPPAMPNTQPMMLKPTGWSNTTAGQLPTSQPPSQPLTIQQEMLQRQQLLQQQLMQQQASAQQAFPPVATQ